MSLIETGSESSRESQRDSLSGPGPPKDAQGAEGGQGLVEYALILLLVAVVVIAVLRILGGRIHDVFQQVINELH